MALILASGSPRRKELLGRLGLSFTIKTADIDEAMDPTLPPEAENARVSRAKALAVGKDCSGDDVILAADTIVVIDGRVLGKPKNESDAAEMLRSLSGRTHHVLTAVTILQGSRAETRVCSTEVCFRKLSEQEIDAYIATGEPMDKAGAYGIQGKGSLLVSEIRGDFFNVMGLPLCMLGEMLLNFGIRVL